MNAADLPFNQFLGIRVQGGQSPAVLLLPDDARYTNHLGTVHAAALFALAEAASGQCFLEQPELTDDRILAVVRGSEIKYRQPARGEIRARARLDADDWAAAVRTLAERGRVFCAVDVELLDLEESVVAHASFRWFFSLME